MENFSRILAAYGMELADGIVMESSSNYYQYPMYIIPNIENTEITSDLAEENANILIPQALGIVSTGSDDVTLTELLSSSSGAYAKRVVDGTISTYEKEDGDIDGPFAYAYLAEKETAESNDENDESDEESGEESTGGRVILISAASLLDETINSTFPQISNLDFYMNCVAELCGDGDSENISIDVKTLTPEYITVPALQSVIWMVVTVIVLPLVVLISGFVVWFRRRKK